MKTISSKELLEKYKYDKNCLIIDLRSKKEYESGHIPFSYNIPFDVLTKQCLYYLNKDNTYYLICKHGDQSKEATKILESNKYNVVNIKDGIISWIGPIEKEN